MSDKSKPQSFSVSRLGKFYSQGRSLESMFGFAPRKDSEFVFEPGVVEQKAFGTNFQDEFQPRVLVKTPSADVIEALGFSATDLEVVVSLSDPLFHMRRVVYRESLSDIYGDKHIKLPLTGPNDSFAKGFEVKCTLTPRTTTAETDENLWHKSQCLVSANFTVKSSAEEGLYEIKWKEFEEGYKSQTLLCVEWTSAGVSSEPSDQCFQVIGNLKLRDQFKRLESNRQLGPLTVRILAYSIVLELVMTTLQKCELSLLPLAESLHEKIKSLIDERDFSFDELALKSQNGSAAEQLEVQQEVSQILQSCFDVGVSVDAVQFGGLR